MDPMMNALQFHREHWFPDTKGFQTITKGYFLMSGRRDWDILEREDLFRFYEMPLVNPSFTGQIREIKLSILANFMNHSSRDG